MKKKLKIRFVKFERVLAMQVLEMAGDFESTEHIGILNNLSSFIGVNGVHIRKCGVFDAPSFLNFRSNAARDEYLQRVLGWITDELFGGAGKLEVGEKCKACDRYFDREKYRKFCEQRGFDVPIAWFVEKPCNEEGTPEKPNFEFREAE